MQNLTYGVSGFHVFEEAQQYTMANRFIQRRKAKDTQTDFPLLRMDNSSCTCPAFLGGGFSYVFCYFVSVLHPSLRSLRPWSMLHSPCMLSSFLRSCWFVLCFFSPCPSFDVDLDIMCFILSFSYVWVYINIYLVRIIFCMLSPRFRYLLRLVWRIILSTRYVSWYVRALTSRLFLVWGTGMRFVSVVVLSSALNLFSYGGNLPLQSYWSLSCHHGLHCWLICCIVAMSSCENNNN